MIFRELNHGKCKTYLAISEATRKAAIIDPIRDKGGAGELRIRYTTLEQLDDFCRRLCSSDSAALGKPRASA